MYRVKQLFGGSLTLRDYDGQVAEAMALVRALNKMTKAGMPLKACVLPENTTRYGETYPKSYLFNKATKWPSVGETLFCLQKNVSAYRSVSKMP